jgi:preprotein translocase subunit SecE
MLKKIRTGLQLTTEELVNKVTWPTWAELQSSAIVVLIASLIVALMVFGIDSIFKFLFEQFYKITQ